METNPLTKYLDDFKSDLITVVKSEVSKLIAEAKPMRMASSDFCQTHNIQRQTLYQWRDKGLIKTEMVGGKLFVIMDSVVRQKYQRKELA